MVAFTAEIDADAAGAAAEAKSTGGAGFPPLLAGKYQATVVKVEGVADFGGKGANSKKKVVRLQLRVLDESPNGAKRTFFARIPLFTRYAPNEDHPKGASAKAFWDFWGKAIGWSDERLVVGDMPGPEDIQGKRITITLSAPISPDSYNPLGYNEVSFYDVAGDLAATPQGKVNVPWLDASGAVIGGAPTQDRPAVQAAPTGPPAWNAAPAPTGPPAWAAAPAAAPVPQAAAQNDAPWSPAAEDVAFASTQTGQGF